MWLDPLFRRTILTAVVDVLLAEGIRSCGGVAAVLLADGAELEALADEVAASVIGGTCGKTWRTLLELPAGLGCSGLRIKTSRK